MTAPPPLSVQALSLEQKVRFRECLLWLNSQPDMDSPTAYAAAMGF